MRKANKATNEELITRIYQWRSDMIEDNNANFAGKSYLDNNLASQKISDLGRDVDFILQVVGELAIRTLTKNEKTPHNSKIQS